jgi:peptidoglycan hydrolase-like protein with peptidoglycan-binding domain
MLQLPPQPLIAAVQQLLGDNGERVGIPDGTHGARTKRAIRDFCTRRGVADCDEEFITIGLVVALLQQPEAEPATQ